MRNRSALQPIGNRIHGFSISINGRAEGVRRSFSDISLNSGDFHVDGILLMWDALRANTAACNGKVVFVPGVSYLHVGLHNRTAIAVVVSLNDFNLSRH